MSRPISSLDYTMSFPTHLQPIPAPIQEIPTSNNSPSFEQRVKSFLSDPNDAPPYGYQDNAVTGIGFWMMYGARFAISMYERGTNEDTIWGRSIQKIGAVFIAITSMPLTIIGALMKGIGSQFPHRVENLTLDMIPKTPAHKIDQIYDLLKIVDGLLRANHIDYSMDGGTLLGAIRHKGIIPHDDDGDLILMYRDKTRLMALSEQLAGHGIIVQDSGLDALKLTFNQDTLRQRYGIELSEAANLDIFFLEQDSDGKIRPRADFYKHQFPREYFLPEEMQNFQDYSFGPPEKGLKLKGLREPMRYLKTYYGPECFEYALQTHSHIQLGPIPFPILNFSKTRYKIVNPTFAEGNLWKRTLP